MKEFAGAKSRLASALSPAARVELAAAMLEDVLEALRAARTLAGTIVVTADPTAAALAARCGGRLLGDGAREGQTRAVTAVAQRLQAEGRDGMLTLPGDIPTLRGDEVDALLALHGEGAAFTIAPAHDGRGSNAIVVSPPAAVPLAFGHDSFLPHIASARRVGIEPRVVRDLPGIALDIDGPDDAFALLRSGRSTRAGKVLARHRLGT